MVQAPQAYAQELRRFCWQEVGERDSYQYSARFAYQEGQVVLDTCWQQKAGTALCHHYTLPSDCLRQLSAIIARFHMRSWTKYGLSPFLQPDQASTSIIARFGTGELRLSTDQALPPEATQAFRLLGQEVQASLAQAQALLAQQDSQNKVVSITAKTRTAAVLRTATEPAVEPAAEPAALPPEKAEPQALSASPAQQKTGASLSLRLAWATTCSKPKYHRRRCRQLRRRQQLLRSKRRQARPHSYR